MQFSDSAVPIGAAAHSFGLETLVAEGTFDVSQLEDFWSGYLYETGAVEAAGCRAGHHLAAHSEDGRLTDTREWLRLNAVLSARKPARESRTASATLGRRLLHLAVDLTTDPILSEAERCAKAAGGDIHHCAAFGLIGGSLGISEDVTASAYLHQNLTGFISACQRLMPLGQQAAARLLWNLKPVVVEAAQSEDWEVIPSFMPLADVAAMRHPTLPTRLFIS
jgi:urease accessory protein